MTCTTINSDIINNLHKIDAKIKAVQHIINSPDNSIFTDEISCILGEVIEQIGECESIFNS